MKKSTKAALAILIVIAEYAIILSTLPAYADFNENMVAYYPFNGNLNDETGNGNNLYSYRASLTSDRYNNPNSAYLFDGITSWLGCDNICVNQSVLNFDKGDFTILAWIKTTDTNGRQRIVNRQCWSLNGYQLSIDNGKIIFGVGSDTPTNFTMVITQKTFNDGEWHLIAGVHRYGDFEAIYVDGVLQTIEKLPNTCGTLSNNQLDVSLCSDLNANSESDMEIGKMSCTNTEYFNGYIDEVKFYNCALSAAEIKKFYNQESTGVKAGIVADYYFQNNANDTSKYVNNGKIIGATLTDDRFGNSNSALIFDGIDDYVEVPLTESSNLRQYLTISVWAKFNAVHSDNGSQFYLIGMNGGPNIVLTYYHSMKAFIFILATELRAINNPIYYWTPEIGRFYHFVGTFNRDTGARKLYLNGEIVAELSGPPSDVRVLDEPWYFGSRNGHVYFFNGVLDDVRIYNRVLSDVEVQALYNDDSNKSQLKPIPDTSQTTSYTDVFGEDSDYTIKPQSYTKLDSNGNDLPDSAIEWVMVRDNVTGLIWENKTDDGSIRDKDNTYTWQNAHDIFIAQLNNDKFGGHGDWRLPTIMELSKLVHADRPYPGPSINTEYFQNTISSNYWSSTINAGDPEYAWDVRFGNGGVSSGYKSHYLHVRAVRGGK